MASATSSPSAEPADPVRAPSLRQRIVLAGTLLLLVIVLAQTGAAWLTLEETEEDLIDQILDQQIAYSIALSRGSSEFAAPNTPDMQLYRIGTGENDAAVPAHLSALPIGNHEIHDGGRELHIAVRQDGQHRYVLTYDVEEHETRLRTLGFGMLLSGIVLAGIFLLVILLLSKQLTTHLDQLARRVAQGDAGERFALAGMDREVLAVAQALDRYAEQQVHALERERNFTADISHELRTPLTSIRTDAELLATLPSLDTTTQKRALGIIDTVDRINRLTTSLLLLARKIQPVLQEELGLAHTLNEVWSPLLAQHGRAATLDLQIPTDAIVYCDPSLLTLVLRNLLDNALRHDASGRIDCRLEGSRLSVGDHGPGFAKDALEMLFATTQRGKSLTGHGLGLAIVQHVCNACGWGLVAANRPDGGAEIQIDFGANLTRP
jgi:signal transduction histidine kinase